MKRKDYTKPTMKVVELRHTGMLMTSGKGVNASRSSYSYGRTTDTGDEDVWE